jgi:hypothetical protein
MDTAGVIGLIPPLAATRVVREVAMASIGPRKKKSKKKRKRRF